MFKPGTLQGGDSGDRIFDQSCISLRHGRYNTFGDTSNIGEAARA